MLRLHRQRHEGFTPSRLPNSRTESPLFAQASRSAFISSSLRRFRRRTCLSCCTHAISHPRAEATRWVKPGSNVGIQEPALAVRSQLAHTPGPPGIGRSRLEARTSMGAGCTLVSSLAAFAVCREDAIHRTRRSQVRSFVEQL